MQFRIISALITAAVVIVMIVLLFAAFIKKMVMPLRKVSDAAKKIASGNFDVVVPVQTHDEIGVLCESFNHMTDHINARTTALAESEARLAEAQQIAHIGSWEWDIVGNELYWSDEIYRIFGLLPQEFGATYEAFLNCVYPDDREFVKKSVNEALYDKKSYDIDHRILLKDTTIRIVHEKAVVIYDDTGMVARMVGTVQDITERKRAEEEVSLLKTLTLSISESKDLHDALVVALEKVCSATGWIYGEAWIPDPEGKCLVRDHAFYSKAERLGKFSELSGAFTFTHGVGLPGRAWSTKKPVWVQDVTLDPNYPHAAIANEAGLKAGVAFPAFSDNEIVVVLVFYMFDELKTDERSVDFISSVVVQLSEIIKRKHMEETKTQLSEITESTTDLVSTATLDGRLLYMNKAGRKVLGIGEDEYIPNLRIFNYHPKWASDLILNEGIPDAIREGAWVGETAFFSRDGREIPFSQVIIVHKNPDGTVRNLSTIGRDISERKRFETQI
ncbi:MAG TPA: PAS domain-containing protein, partial [Candidatus Wunengus sp. YC63]|uniref:PAS domain-containing protein n=1 Tax=unclassified Candidatus Wunengus TaxID=3367695 RepID=UPI004029B067